MQDTDWCGEAPPAKQIWDTEQCVKNKVPGTQQCEIKKN